MRLFHKCLLKNSTFCVFWCDPEKLELSGPQLEHHLSAAQRHARGHLNVSVLPLRRPFVGSMLGWTVRWQVTECTGTPELCVSSGLAPLGQLRYENATLVSVPLYAHNTCPRMHKNRLLFLSHTLAATHSQLSSHARTHGLNRCKSLGEVGQRTKKPTQTSILTEESSICCVAPVLSSSLILLLVKITLVTDDV